MIETQSLKSFRQEYIEPLFRQYCKDNPYSTFTEAVDKIWSLRKEAEDLYANTFNKATIGA